MKNPILIVKLHYSGRTLVVGLKFEIPASADRCDKYKNYTRMKCPQIELYLPMNI